jgi:hypothetical protein
MQHIRIVNKTLFELFDGEMTPIDAIVSEEDFLQNFSRAGEQRIENRMFPEHFPDLSL